MSGGLQLCHVAGKVRLCPKYVYFNAFKLP